MVDATGCVVSFETSGDGTGIDTAGDGSVGTWITVDVARGTVLASCKLEVFDTSGTFIAAATLLVEGMVTFTGCC